ncbi:4-coumarate--CoA ligase-like 5 [Acorus calamus]|uniref:4-coumarate--CoA ligase n=1 Tax=Acorus calamus TaxID=4465 RepID=A0AAV9CLX0_ACOCL|nr:4-coumarate--CoA ligase-like 5 [Acorus calamus]
MEIIEESGFCPSNSIYYSKWDPPSLPQDPSLSLPTFLLSQSTHPSKPAYIDSKSGHTITYGRLQTLASSVASTLINLGIKKGDVVLLVSRNSLQYPLLVLGIMSAGAIFSTANPLNTREEIQTQVQDSKPKLIITTRDLQPKLDGLVSKPLLFVGELGLACGATCKPVHVLQGDPAALMYSSGTTGKSKAVVSTHRNLIAMSCLLRHAWGAAEEEIVDMCVVPMCHMFGFSVFVMGALAAGSTVVVMERYAVEEVFEAVEKHRVSRIPAVPPMVIQMGRSRDVVRGYDVGSLKELVCSGAPIAREHLERFTECLPQVTVTQCYGLTETSGPITLCDGVKRRFHVSIGRLIPSMEAKIVDTRTGKALPPGRSGELWVRGPSIMQGYLEKPEATALVLNEEGWLHTGDLCFVDSRGFIYIVDRIKELIKYKAYQVAPAELEEILSTHTEVNDVAVIPHPDEETGEIPMACVVRKAGSKIKEDDIISFMEDKVAPYKKIRKVIFVNHIPRSPSGKILRRYLKPQQQLQIFPRM